MSPSPSLGQLEVASFDGNQNQAALDKQSKHKSAELDQINEASSSSSFDGNTNSIEQYEDVEIPHNLTS